MIFRKPRHVDGALTCVQVARALQRYLDGMIDEKTAGLVAAHLDDCRRCGMKASEFRRIKKSLSDIGEAPTAESVDRLREFAARLTSDPD